MVGGGSVPEPENPLKALERQLQCSLKVKGNTVTDAGGWGIGIMRPDGTIEVFVWGGE